MAPQRLEKIECGRGNGMGSEASNLQHLVHGRTARKSSRKTILDLGKLQKKAPNTLKSLDAELKSAPAFRQLNAAANAGTKGGRKEIFLAAKP
jgi:hypothetical protein